jgi:hypothetical protein
MRDTTSKYVVHIVEAGLAQGLPISWNCKRDGRPTDANLAKYVEAYEASTRRGGMNEHLGATTVMNARINELGGATVAAYTDPR